MFDYYFHNGVRVAIEDPDHPMTPHRKRAIIVDYLTKIAAGLGGTWTVGISHEMSAYVYLHRDGGYQSPNGITLCLYNPHTSSTDKSRPDYWKYSVDGKYQQPTGPSSGHMSLSGEPKINIKIDDTKRAIAAINRILPEIERWTKKARAHVASENEKEASFENRLNWLTEITGHEFGPHQRSCTQITFHSYLYGGKQAKFSLYKGTHSVEMALDLTDDELPQVLAYIRQLRGYEPLATQ
jgi:hypothetical protein